MTTAETLHQATPTVRRLLQRQILPIDRDTDVFALYVDPEEAKLDADRYDIGGNRAAKDLNNAAIRREAALTEMSYADWREIIAIVLDGAFLCARAAIPHMQRQGGGRIVNIGGVSAHTGAIERAHVASAKMGLVGLTHALAVEFAPAGITANCVAPGKIGGKRSATSGAGVARRMPATSMLAYSGASHCGTRRTPAARARWS